MDTALPPQLQEHRCLNETQIYSLSFAMPYLIMKAFMSEAVISIKDELQRWEGGWLFSVFCNLVRVFCRNF